MSEQTEAVETLLAPLYEENVKPEVVAGIYSKWADTYEKDLQAMSNGYRHPDLIAEIASNHVTSDMKSQPILDLCCGTGLGGAALKSRGFSVIDGLDASREMLAKAAEKFVYRQLLCELVQPTGIQCVPEGSYIAVVTSGSFVPGHLGPQHVAAIADVIKPGGLFCMAMRDAYLQRKDMDVRSEFDRLVRQGVFEPVLECEIEGYHSDKLGRGFVFRKLAGKTE